MNSVDIKVLNRDAALERMGGDEELYQEILQLFCEDAPKQLQQLMEAAAGGDRKAAERTAHSLKSAAANIGADRLSQACLVCERAYKAGEDEANIKDMLANISAEMEQLNKLLS